jgi:hypothetical protein
MNGYYVSKYPYAAGLVRKYTLVLNQLTAYHSVLANQVSALDYTRQSVHLCKNDEMKGDYYDSYCDDVDDWERRFGLVIGDFTNSLHVLSRRIDEANSLITKYHNMSLERIFVSTSTGGQRLSLE